MSTVVLVSRVLDPDSSVRGFVAQHVRALADEFERVIVVACRARGDVQSLGVEVVDAGDDVQAIETALAGVLEDAHGRTVVVVEDDLACLVASRAAITAGDVPLLWWCTQVPGGRAVVNAPRWADGIVVAAPPLVEVPDCPVWAVGAGIDLQAGFPEASPLGPRPPLRLLALGRTAPVKGLPVVLRAVAIARSHGLDAQLRIVGPSTTAEEIEHRRELEALIANIALSAVVQIDDGVPRRQIPDILRDSHVLVDAGGDDDMSISTLEAMAAGRIVLTASRRVAAILPESQPALSFEAGNAFELADRIVGLDGTWATGLPRIGDLLRQVVEREHSLDHWRRQFATAVDQVRPREAARTHHPGEPVADPP